MATVTEQYAKMIGGALDVILAPPEQTSTPSVLHLLAQRRGAEAAAAWYRDVLALAETGALHLSPTLREQLRLALEVEEREVERLTAAIREVG
jgi:hypothetical protein